MHKVRRHTRLSINAVPDVDIIKAVPDDDIINAVPGDDIINAVPDDDNQCCSR